MARTRKHLLDEIERDLMPAVLVQYALKSQHDLDTSRHPEQGSSCCSLFAATFAANVLSGTAVLDDMDAMQKLLLQCVRQWDALVEGTGDFAMGADPLQVFQHVALERQLRYTHEQFFPVARENLLHALAQPTAPWAAIITAIPACIEQDRNVTGDTFVLCVMQDRVCVVDSHRHVNNGRCRGTVRALVEGAGLGCISAMIDWIYKTDGGLLQQMKCKTDLLQVFIVRQSGGDGCLLEAPVPPMAEVPAAAAVSASSAAGSAAAPSAAAASSAAGWAAAPVAAEPAAPAAMPDGTGVFHCPGCGIEKPSKTAECWNRRQRCQFCHALGKQLPSLLGLPDADFAAQVGPRSLERRCKQLIGDAYSLLKLPTRGACVRQQGKRLRLGPPPAAAAAQAMCLAGQLKRALVAVRAAAQQHDDSKQLLKVLQQSMLRFGLL